MHAYVCLYLVSLLLHEDIAEHILLELAARLCRGSNVKQTRHTRDDAFNDRMWMRDINIWSDEKLREMKTNVIALMNAAGDSYGALDLSKSIPEMIEMFLVGTKQRNARKERSPPKPSELGPIKDMKFPSTAKMGKLL